MSSLTETLKSIRRKPNRATTNSDKASSATEPIRLSGTVPVTNSEFNRNPSDPGLGDDNPNGRMGNDWLAPDLPRGRFDVSEVNGDRLQDFANTHLSEGEAPGRIPRGWNSRNKGKTGDGISGNPDGSIGSYITTTGDPNGGIAGQMYVPHTPTPRSITTARTYQRTVDDAANVPGVFIGNPRG